MTQQGSEPSGDYGYDLVHEEIAGGRTRDRRSGQEPGSGFPAAGPAEGGGDLEYDEAHDFRSAPGQPG